MVIVLWSSRIYTPFKYRSLIMEINQITPTNSRRVLIRPAAKPMGVCYLCESSSRVGYGMLKVLVLSFFFLLDNAHPHTTTRLPVLTLE